MKAPDHERRDATLFALLMPLGIGFMLFAGQVAIQLAPSWIVHAEMASNLNPGAPQNTGNIPPISSDILTPMPWSDNFLTPGAQPTSTGEVVPFVVLEPSATPSPSASPTSTDPATQTSTSTSTSTSTATSTATATATATKRPKDPPPSPTLPPVTSTPEGTQVSIPPGFNQGTPNGSFASIPDGDYVVVTLSTPVVVSGPTDTAPDMVYYERTTNPTQIAMDGVIVGISQNASGNPYYEVFNWGDGTPDTNTNLDYTSVSPPPNPASPPEADNALISTSSLYPGPGTGIAIDVDNADSHPPPGNYPYVVIVAPASPPADGNDGAEVDSVQVLP